MVITFYSLGLTIAPWAANITLLYLYLMITSARNCYYLVYRS